MSEMWNYLDGVSIWQQTIEMFIYIYTHYDIGHTVVHTTNGMVVRDKGISGVNGIFLTRESLPLIIHLIRSVNE